MWQQGLDWLRSNAPAYALFVGSIYFGLFWLIDHTASRVLARFLPAPGPSPERYRRNMLSVLRRMFLLCSTMVLLGLDYLPLILPKIMPLLPASAQQIPMNLLALPGAMVVIAAWLATEIWITRTLVVDDMDLRQWWLTRQLQRHRTNDAPPGLVDWVQLPAAQKQRLMSTETYGRMSEQLNRWLYLLTYVHLMVWIYQAKTG